MNTNTNTPVWAYRHRAELISAGATTIVLLEKGTFGWKLRSWTRTVGQPRVQAEGTPVYEQTYGTFEEAYTDYSGLAVEAIEHPMRFTDATDRLVDREVQRQINRAASEEEAIRVNEEVRG